MTILDTLRRWLGRGDRSSAPRNADRTRSDQTPVEVIDLEGAFEAHQAGARFIDVREPAEFAAGRIHGALLHPLSTFEPKAIPTDGSRRVIFQCGSGKRSRQALEAYMAATGADAAHLEGGIGAWKGAGQAQVRRVSSPMCQA